jgi:predicted ATPase/class 3 adenylate cyclase/Tfp pilus assembly protein PilF
MDRAAQPFPSGTVTFLFTDIEGSTRLWEHDAPRMWEVLGRHNAILGDAIRAHHGWHFKTIGDAFQAAFADPADGVAAAVAAQQALHAEPWPEKDLIRVRMGLHIGPAEPTPSGDYLAPPLNRLSRLLSAGYGGQVLLSSALREALGERFPAGVTAISLGKHRLRDLQDAEEVWQLVIPGHPATFPPLKSQEKHPTNLPPEPTPLVGREEEVCDLRDLLVAPDSHVVTLTGPGGVGKTRLALAAASEALADFADGVFVVSLAGVDDASLLLPEVAAVLGVREGGGLSFEENLFKYLEDKRLLLVLDNLEQLEPFEAAAAAVARLMTTRVLATSRMPLRIRAEREWPVAPLETPPPMERIATEGDLAELAANPAVALFVQGARAARPAWNITLANALDVAEITRRLDGLPLAIELAAVRIRVLSPAEILRRLSDALDLLQAKTGDRPDRQQTLRAAIDWSFDLLNFENQAAFRRLGVFAGGFTMETAEKVLAEAPDPWIDVLDAVSILVEHSLLQTSEDAEANTRYGMLEVIRSFALEQLSEAKEDDELFKSLAKWADRFGRDADQYVYGTDGGLWLERFETEHDNFRGAMEWAIEHDPNDLGLRLPESMWRFWELRGHFTEGRLWLERALAAAPEGPPGLRALALDGLGNIAGLQGDLRVAQNAHDRSLAIWRKLGDRKSMAGALSNLGNIVELQGDFIRARALQEEALAVAREIGEPLRIALALNNLALVLWNMGDIAGATELLEESVVLKRREGNRAGLATSLNNLGSLLADEGHYERAKVYLEETLAIDRELGNPGGIADSLGNLASLAAITGDVARAAALDAEALQLRRDIDDRLSIAYSLESIASTASRAGLAPDGAKLFGAAEQLRADLGAPLPPSELGRYEKGLDFARTALAGAEFDEAFAAGRRLSLDNAVAEALRVSRNLAGSGSRAT